MSVNPTLSRLIPCKGRGLHFAGHNERGTKMKDAIEKICDCGCKTNNVWHRGVGGCFVTLGHRDYMSRCVLS